MTKKEFLDALEGRLGGLSREGIEERISFYSEMIDDRIEEGLSESEAVFDIGSLDDIAAQTVQEYTRAKIEERDFAPKRRMRTWEIVLLALGAPIWLALAIAAVAVVFSLYITLWSLVASAWAVFGALAGSALGCATGGAVIAISGNGLIGVAVIGAAVTLSGLSIFAFIGCKAATHGTVKLTQTIVECIKKRFTKEGRYNEAIN